MQLVIICDFPIFPIAYSPLYTCTSQLGDDEALTPTELEESEAEGEQDENPDDEAGEEGEEGEESEEGEEGEEGEAAEEGEEGEEAEEGEDEEDEVDDEGEKGAVEDVDVEGLMEDVEDDVEEEGGGCDQGTKDEPPKQTNIDQAETLEMDVESYWRIDPSFVGNGVSPPSAKKEEEPTEPNEKPKQFKRLRKHVKGSEDQVKESEEKSVPMVEDLCSDDEKHNEKGTFQADGGRLDLGLTSGIHEV